MSSYFATCARGIEEVAALELRALGATAIKPGYGGVYFDGNLETLYRANLWLRTVTRVLMPIKEFSAASSAMLYDQVRRIRWGEYLNAGKTFAVDCTISGQQPGAQGPTNSHFVALKIKDSIVDQLRERQGARPSIDTASPDIRIHAYLRGTRCTLSLDSSGRSLHERGYRLKGAEAPLKETLAAAILELTEWDAQSPFIDPMCGSGTLSIEAGMKALGIAPGLSRAKFGFMGWPDFDKALWKRLCDEARAFRKDKLYFPIVGYDNSRDAVAAAIENSRTAGVARSVHFEKRDVSRLEPVGEKPGVVLVNPPYGERMGEVQELESLYKGIGDLFKQKMKGWTGFIFTGNLELAKHVGLRTKRRIELYNGAIECRLLRYDLY